MAAVAGMIGPLLFGTVLLALSALEYDFMLGIGWRPVTDPAGAWPSGLALGPYGVVQVANFVASGLLLAFFAIGLHLGATSGRGSPLGPVSSSRRGRRWRSWASRPTRYGGSDPGARTA